MNKSRAASSQQQKVLEWMQLITGLFAVCECLKLVPMLEPVDGNEMNNFGNLMISAYNF